MVNPYSVSFTFDSKEETDESEFNRMEEIDFLQGHGFGVSIITKIMDSVTYSFVGEGKYDWVMIKNLETE